MNNIEVLSLEVTDFSRKMERDGAADKHGEGDGAGAKQVGRVRVGIWTPEDFQDIKVRTGQSSIAGAGSGEFHMYNDRTRRERERVSKMQEEDAAKRAREEFERKQEENRRLDEEKTAKNRSKRQKRKQSGNKKSGKGDGSTGGAVAAASLLLRGNVANDEQLGAGVRARWVQRAEGEAQKEWQVETGSASCILSLDGYALYKFRDAAGDVRESMATRLGDYMLLTADVPHVWESVSASRLLIISVQQPLAALATPAFASGYAPQHEGAFFVGSKSLAPDRTLRKTFPLDACYSALANAGEQGKGIAAQGSQSAVILMKGKSSVSCGGETCLLGSAGDFVVCAAHEQVNWTAMAPATVVLALLFPRN